ncbi:ComF family protein [Psychromicrobium lacuslunae]|uniref:ComF family protein n=1 Tax=Psychromicrobium lacuslunae TaxID=1618207 RepID=UPI000696FB14|nr:phosphoribosyltransferase family protein [Psychromicrobium lacuslunae]
MSGAILAENSGAEEAAKGSAQHRAEPRGRWQWLFDQLLQAAEAVADLVFPRVCASCERPAVVLCSDCHRALSRATRFPVRAEMLAESLSSAQIVSNAGAVPMTVLAAGMYRDHLARVILAFKNHSALPLAKPLAQALWRTLVEIAHSEGFFEQGVSGLPSRSMMQRKPGRQPGLPLLVPVPGTGTAYRRRGYHPLLVLLAALQRQAGTKLPVRKLLRRSWRAGFRGSAQPGLSARQRRRRLAGSMLVPARLSRRRAGSQCLLVDDVMTTGATLAEAKRALEQAGLSVVAAIVLAAVPKYQQTIE